MRTETGTIGCRTPAALRLPGLALLALLGALFAALLLSTSASAANPAADLDQWANLDSQWQNGNLNESNSRYREADSVPFRARLTNLSTSGSHTLVIQYDTLQGGKHAYDYLTSYDRTVAPNPCASVAPCASGSGASIPGDSSISFANPASSQLAGSFSIWNGAVAGVSYGSSDSAGQRSVTVTFTASNASVVLAWGGHIGSQIDWGAGNSASAISGSPYHMRILSLDGSGGNQDRSLKASAVLPVPATFDTTASPASATVGQPVTDLATLSGPNGAVSGSVTFFVCGPNLGSNPDCTFGGTQVGSAKSLSGGQATSDGYVPSEGGHYCFRAEYAPDTFALYSPGTHTNATTECFEATLPLGQLEVVKNLVSGNGLFNLLIKSGDGSSIIDSELNVGNGGTTGKNSLAAGSYQVSETAGNGTSLATYNASIECRSGGGSGAVVASATGSGPLGVSIVNGSNVKCTITNALKPAPKVTVSKVCPNGKAAGTDRFGVNNNGQSTGAVLDCGGSADVTLSAGQAYSIDETAAGSPAANLSNYTTSLSAGCSGTLSLGDTATCTITNTLKAAPHVTVHKACPGGAANAGDLFGITNNGQATGQQLACGGSTDVAVGAGQGFSFDEVAAGTASLADYTKSLSASCSGTLAAFGQSADCTITNTVKAPPSIVVHKLCPNGKANVGDRFGVTANGQATGASLDCNASATIAVPAGAYSLAEVAGGTTDLANYTTTLGAGCSGTLARGQSAECTLTNTLKAKPHVLVHKACPNGTAAAGDRFGVTNNGQATGSQLACDGTVDVQLPTGAYSIDEAAAGTTDLANYTKTLSATCTGSLAHYGDSADCTITNTLKPAPDVEVHKVCPNGKAATSDLFRVTKNGTSTGVILDCGDRASFTLGAGEAYSFNETGAGTTDLANYTKTLSATCTGSLAHFGDEVECTITNTLKPKPHVAVHKLCPNGAAHEGDRFTVTNNGSATGKELACGGTADLELGTGAYAIDEAAAGTTSLGDYVKSLSAGCAGTLAHFGDSADCTITNTLKPKPHVTVTKACPNGTAHPQDLFAVTNNGGQTETDLACGESTQLEVNPDAGYSIDEAAAGTTNLDDYAKTLSEGCAGTLRRGESAACTITNTLKPNPHVTVDKVCPHGKSRATDRFGITNALHPTGTTLDCGGSAEVEVDPGAYSIGEVGAGTPPANLGDYVTTLSESCSGTLQRGEQGHCTITNTLKPGAIEIRKSLLPTSDGGKFNLLLDGTVRAANVGNAGTTGSLAVAPGPHAVAETAGTGSSLGDYTSSIDCTVAGISVAKGSGAGPLSVQVAPGTSVICTVTNVRHDTPPPPPPPPTTGTIEVVKALLPATDAGKFDLQVDGVTKKAGAGDKGTTGQVTVPFGQHTVAEVAAAGTDLAHYDASVQCKQDVTVLASGSGNTLAVNVTPGAHVVCTVTNVRKAIDLAVTKHDNRDPVSVGQSFSYAIVVTNKGPGTATNVTLSDPLPVLVQFVSVVSTQGTCTGGAEINCALGTIGPGGTATVTVVVKALHPGTALNTAIVVAGEPESAMGDNRASETTRIVAPFTPPPAPACYVASVRPNQLTVGKRTTMIVVLRAHGKAVVGAKVVVRGPGIFKSARTDRRGVARIAFVPRRAGITRVTVAGHKTCSQPRIGVAGVFTPPVTG